MAFKFGLHDETATDGALTCLAKRARGSDHAALDSIARGLASCERLEVLWSSEHPLTATEMQRLAARQIVVDVVEFVVPKLGRREDLVGVLRQQLDYELFGLSSGDFLRWVVADPERYLVGAVDQMALAAADPPERIAKFAVEGRRSRPLAQFFNKKFVEVSAWRDAKRNSGASRRARSYGSAEPWKRSSAARPSRGSTRRCRPNCATGRCVPSSTS